MAQGSSAVRPTNGLYLYLLRFFFLFDHTSVRCLSVRRLQRLTRQAMDVYRNIEERSHNHCWRKKAINITYSDCVFVATLGYTEYEALRRVILSLVACPAVPYFYTLSHKLRDFREKTFLNTKCVWNISHCKNNSARYHKCTCTVPAISEILMKLEFSRQIFEKYSNLV